MPTFQEVYDLAVHKFRTTEIELQPNGDIESYDIFFGAGDAAEELIVTQADAIAIMNEVMTGPVPQDLNGGIGHTWTEIAQRFCSERVAEIMATHPELVAIQTARQPLIQRH